MQLTDHGDSGLVVVGVLEGGDDAVDVGGGAGVDGAVEVLGGAHDAGPDEPPPVQPGEVRAVRSRPGTRARRRLREGRRQIATD